MRFSIAYVAAYLASIIGALVVYTMRDGTVDVALLGGYGSIIAGLLYALVVGSFVSGFYAYISGSTGHLYEELAEAKVVDRADLKVRELTIGRGNSIERAHDKPVWVLLSCSFAILSGAYMLYTVTLHPMDVFAEYQSMLVMIMLPVWLVGWYMIIMIALRALISIWGLYRVFRLGDVLVRPLHPDKCGGLRSINDYALLLTYLIAVCGFGLVLLIYNSIQISRLPQDLQLFVGLGLYVVLAPLTFFGTLGTAHGAMKKVKVSQLQSLSNRFDEDYKFIQENLDRRPEEIRDRLERLQQIHSVYQITESFPVWPFDSRSIRRFTGAVFSPLFVSIITILYKMLI